MEKGSSVGSILKRWKVTKRRLNAVCVPYSYSATEISRILVFG